MKKALFGAGIALGLSTFATATMVFVPIDITTGTGSVATQSTPVTGTPPGSGFPDRAINGSLGDFTHTSSGDPNPSWSVDLGRDETFNTIIVHNRSSCCGDRLVDITVGAFDSAMNQLYSSGVTSPGNVPSFTYSLPAAVTARSISVSRLGTSAPAEGVLSLGEVRIGNLQDVTLPLGTNLTMASIVGLSASQSSNFNGTFVAGLAIDGNAGNFTHTASADNMAWWRLDFGEEMLLENVDILNRNNCCGERLRDITVSVLDAGGSEVFSSPLLNPANAEGFTGVGAGGLFYDFTNANGGSPVQGQTLLLSRTADPLSSGDDANVISLGEVIVMGGSIPEPSTAALLGLALSGLVLRRRR